MKGKKKRWLAAAGVVLLALGLAAWAGMEAAAPREPEELGMVLTAHEGGALVVAVMEDSAAAAAGVVPGDVLVEYDGRAFSEADLTDSCFRRVRQETRLVVERDGARIPCTLGR
jgi:C-terminal processing protease CtpA/Prc